MSNGSTTLSQECDSLTTHASRHPSYDVSLYNVRVQIYALPEQWCCVERDILVSKQWCCVERYILVSKQYHRGNMKHHAKGLGRDNLHIQSPDSPLRIFFPSFIRLHLTFVLPSTPHTLSRLDALFTATHSFRGLMLLAFCCPFFST